jgi:hypothetical protein
MSSTKKLRLFNNPRPETFGPLESHPHTQAQVIKNNPNQIASTPARQRMSSFRSIRGSV